MAKTLTEGGGYCLSPGLSCAFFPPVYPTVVAAGILTGHPLPAIAFLCALAGAGTVWLIWLIGNRTFGTTAALLATAWGAFYPYFIWHDAVLQETGILTFIVTAAIYFLLRGDRWILTGALLALTVLTKANLSLFVPAALLWLAFFSPKRALWTTLGVALLLAPWVARTWHVTGTPIIYSNGGFSLYTAQHPRTFDYFPRLSIDEASIAEVLENPPGQKEACDPATDPNGIRCTVWYWNAGMNFIKARPLVTLGRGLQKIGIAFSPVFSPEKSLAFETFYFISYFPLLILSGFGAWRARSQWRELGFIYLLILTFATGCAVFWGHTSHRMYLEPCLMLLAARAVTSPGT